MTHDEFVNLIHDPQYVWGVQGFYRPVRLALGVVALAVVVVAMGAILTIPGGLAVEAFRLGHPGYAFWSAGAIVSWLFARPNFGLGDVLVRVTSVGVPLALLPVSQLSAAGAASVFGAWLLGALVKYVTMGAMELRLQHSVAAFERLQTAGLLLLGRRA